MKLPEQIGNYKILDKLGEGAGGIVVKAQHEITQRVVAMKIVFNHIIQAKPLLVKRFHREARLASSLVHPNIVPIFEVGEADGSYYYTMQYIPGIPMTKYIARKTLSLNYKMHITLLLCEALAVAHERGIIHRDLKPHNVIITKEFSPIIVDFGIAKSLVEGEEMTQAGHILGSAHYMAPEQASSAEVGTYTDVFGLGVMMYEFFTGERPFQGDNVSELIVGRVQYSKDPEKYRPQDIHLTVKDFPPELNSIVMKALDAKPENRYQDAGELVEDLRKFQEEERFWKRLEKEDVASGKIPQKIDFHYSYTYPILFSFLTCFCFIVAGALTAQGKIPALRGLQKSGADLIKSLFF